MGDGMERLARCPFVWPGPSPQLLPSASAAALLDAKAGHLAVAIWSQDTRWPRAETNHRDQLELNKMTPWREWLQ